MINISIIIPNYNGAKFLVECLENLKIATNLCPKSKFEVILVDNGSSDNSLKMFSSLVTHNCQLITNSSNLGFATAVNQGIVAAKYQYVCLLNNDVNLDKNYFKLITNNIKKYPEVACFCGTVLNKDGTEIESQGIRFDWAGKCYQDINNQHGYIWGSSGAVVIYKKEILQKIGLFDQKYFAYIEDVDVAFRLQKNGYKTLLIPKAIVYHLGGGTSNKMGNFRAKQTFKNWIYFIAKNYSKKEIIKYLPKITVERLRNLSYLIKSTINK